MMDKFEIGKYYQHTSGAQMYVLAKVGTHNWGFTTLAETGHAPGPPKGVNKVSYRPKQIISLDNQLKKYYHEITKEEFKF